MDLTSSIHSAYRRIFNTTTLLVHATPTFHLSILLRTAQRRRGPAAGGMMEIITTYKPVRGVFPSYKNALTAAISGISYPREGICSSGTCSLLHSSASSA